MAVPDPIVSLALSVGAWAGLLFLSALFVYYRRSVPVNPESAVGEDMVVLNRDDFNDMLVEAGIRKIEKDLPEAKEVKLGRDLPEEPEKEKKKPMEKDEK